MKTLKFGILFLAIAVVALIYWYYFRPYLYLDHLGPHVNRLEIYCNGDDADRAFQIEGTDATEFWSKLRASSQLDFSRYSFRNNIAIYVFDASNECLGTVIVRNRGDGQYPEYIKEIVTSLGDFAVENGLKQIPNGNRLTLEISPTANWEN